MRIVAVMEPIGNQPAIADAQWEALVRRHPQLAGLPERKVINPFTKQEMVLPPRWDSASVLVAGVELGSIEWAQDGSNCLLVRAEGLRDWDVLLAVARDVAESLGVTCNTEHDVVLLSADEHEPFAQEDPIARTIRLWRAGDREGAICCYMAGLNVDLKEALRVVPKLVGDAD